MTALNAILHAATTGDDISELVHAYGRESGMSFAESADRIAVVVARSFLDRELTFDEADTAADVLWTLMCRKAHKIGPQAIPDLAYAIFDAFDQGEYRHGDAADPIDGYTIPLLRSALGSGD